MNAGKTDECFVEKMNACYACTRAWRGKLSDAILELSCDGVAG